MAVGQQATDPTHRPLAVAGRGGRPRGVPPPPGGHHGLHVRPVGHGVHGPHRGASVDEQAVPFRVEPRERRSVGSPGGGQRGGQVGLLGQEVGDPVTEAPGLHCHHEGLVVDQVEQDPLVAGQPRQPRLHAVEQLAVGQAVPLLAAPRLLGDQGGGPDPDPVVGHQFPTWVQLDLSPGRGGPLVGHRELGEPLHLVVPQVDSHRRVVGGRPDVDDRTPHRDLTTVLDLVLAAIAGGHQGSHQAVAVDDVARSDADGFGGPSRRSEALDEGPTGGHDHGGPVGEARQAVQDAQAPAHGLHCGADPLKRQGLPGREVLDGVVAQHEAQVGHQPLGLGAGGDGHHQRGPAGAAHQRCHDDGPSRLGDGQRGGPSTEAGLDGRVVVEQRGEAFEKGAHRSGLRRSARVTSGR